MTECEARFQKTVTVQCELEDGHTGLHYASGKPKKREETGWTLLKNKVLEKK